MASLNAGILALALVPIASAGMSGKLAMTASNGSIAASSIALSAATTQLGQSATSQGAVNGSQG